MSDRDALLRTILLHPAENTPRLVYADWLQEHGGEPRAEFIRDTRGNWPHVYFLWDELAASIPTAKLAGYGREDETGLPRWTFNLPHLWGKAVWDRGFVAELHLPLAAFMEHAPALFRAHPIERVTLTDRRPIIGRVWQRDDTLAGATPEEAAAGLPRELIEFGHRNFRTGRAADRWLSWRCVAYGRGLADLPALPVKEPRGS